MRRWQTRGRVAGLAGLVALSWLGAAQAQVTFEGPARATGKGGVVLEWPPVPVPAPGPARAGGAALGTSAPLTSGPSATPAMAGALPLPPPATTAATPAEEVPQHAAAWLREVNTVRARGANCGGTAMPPVPPLNWSGALGRAAEAHARDMAQQSRQTHTGSDGSSVSVRADRQGYSFDWIGENVAYSQRDMSAAIGAWLGSPGHCMNMLASKFGDIGLAQAQGSRDRYYAMVLGKSSAGALPAMSAAESNTKDPRQVLAILNRLRAQGGVCADERQAPSPPLQWDERVSQMAQWDLFRQQHGRSAAGDPGGHDTLGRLKVLGYLAERAGGGGTPGNDSPVLAIQSFLGDKPLCRYLYSPHFRHIALAGGPGGWSARDGRWWWSLVLATSW